MLSADKDTNFVKSVICLKPFRAYEIICVRYLFGVHPTSFLNSRV